MVTKSDDKWWTTAPLVAQALEKTYNFFILVSRNVEYRYHNAIIQFNDDKDICSAIFGWYQV